MRNCILIFVLVSCFSISTFSQSCYPDQNDLYWKISESLYGSRRLSNCDPIAYYNCHGFVISYFEDGCNSPSWFAGLIPGSYNCPNGQRIKYASNYQNSGKYIQVCNETSANIAYYQFSIGDHSAVKEEIGGGVNKYLSKYNYNGPLVAHNLTGSWYALDGQDFVPPKPIQFWSYLGPISGNNNSNNIVGLNPITFSVNSISGVTYTWTILSGNSNIYISSSSNQNSITLVPTHSGVATLSLCVSTSCGSATQQKDLNIQTNVCLEGTYSNAGITGQNLNTVNRVSVGSVNATVTCPNATSLTWQRIDGSITDYFQSDGNVLFTMTSGGSINFSVTAKNGSTTIATRSVAFYNLGSFMVSPNPVSNELKIDLNKELPFTVLLQSFDGQIKKEIKNYIGGSKIDVSGLKSGNYSLVIYFEGKVVNQKQIIVSKGN